MFLLLLFLLLLFLLSYKGRPKRWVLATLAVRSAPCVIRRKAGFAVFFRVADDDDDDGFILSLEENTIA